MAFERSGAMNSTTLDRTLGEHPDTYLLTRSGTRLRVRPVALADGNLLAEFLAKLTPDDLRFRFLDTRKVPSPIEVERTLGFHAREITDEPGLLLLEADLA